MMSSSVKSELQILQTRSLTQLVEDELERMIVDGEASGGTRISEQAVAERLGVSRSPVREAFRALVEAGLLVAIRNRGVFVREVSLEEVLELYDARAALEAEIATGVAATLKAPTVKALRKVIEQMRRAARAGELDPFYLCNLRFHSILLEACSNGRLREIYKSVVRSMHLYRREGLDRFGSLDASTEAHEALLDVLVSRDGPRVREAFRQHVLAGKERLAQGLARSASPAISRSS